MQFTVVIPLYNKERHINRAVRSVLNQTYKDFEIIVVDDGSTDDSVRNLSLIKDYRLRIIKQSNMGVSSARNMGINEAKFDYIAFLDADDVWKPNFLEVIKILIDKYPMAGAYATAYEIRKEDTIIDQYLSREKIEKDWEGVIDDYFKLSFKSPLISASSVVIPKKIFKQLGNFPLGIKRGEDLDMWCRIALNYDIAYLNKICAIYFYDSDNRACKNKGELEESFASYAEDVYLSVKESGNPSMYFEEYMINIFISKARYLIFEGKRKEARSLLFKYRFTKLNKKSLIKIYILSCMSQPIYNLAINIKKKISKI